jgi:hypothetical protein
MEIYEAPRSQGGTERISCQELVQSLMKTDDDAIKPLFAIVSDYFDAAAGAQTAWGEVSR